MKKGKDIPIPTMGRYRKYPLNELVVGEYLEFERESKEARQLGVEGSRGTVHVAKRLRVAASHYMRKNPETHFIVRTDVDANVVRVWRDR